MSEKKLTQEGLVELIDSMPDWMTSESIRIQLKEIVEEHFKEQGLPEKRALTIEEVIQKYPEQVKKALQQKPTVTRTEIENAVGDTSSEYTEGVVELFESKGFEVKKWL